MRALRPWRLAVAVACLGQLGLAVPLRAQCTDCVGDANSDGTVTVNELILAVNNALVGCDGATASPTPTGPTAVVTATPTATPVQACAVTPGAWSAPAWSTNTADALALRAQLGALTGAGAMRGAEQGTVVLGGVAQLEDLYEAGAPSLADVANSGFDPLVADAFADFVALVDAGGGDPIDDDGTWAPGPNGGIFGTSQRGLNAGGIESRQIVDKGLFAGGALYPYALSLTEGPISPATVDALAAAWGANEALDPAGTLIHSANYSRQMGFHGAMAAALTDAKAYAADGACGAQRDAAIVRFFRLWEQSMYARTVFYVNRGLTLSTGATDDNDHIEALHLLGEGLGLAAGFLGLADPTTGPLAGAGRTISDAAIGQVLAAHGFNAADQSASTTGTLIENVADFGAAALAVEAAVAEAFDLEPSEVQAYRNPTAG
jgi:hypothetical protein